MEPTLMIDDVIVVKECDIRELKNTYITYAEKNGIEIENSEVLETIDEGEEGYGTYSDAMADLTDWYNHVLAEVNAD